MRKPTTRPLVVLATVATIVFGATGAASARAALTSGTPDADSGSARSTTTVETQRGIVMEGWGEAHGLTAMVTVYENSLYGNSVQVVIGDPDDDRIGASEQHTPYVVDGRLDTSVQVDGRPATLTGTVEVTGRPTKVVEPLQDGGEQIVTRGTQSALHAQVTLTYDGISVPVTFAPAFAYELDVRTVTLYGR